MLKIFVFAVLMFSFSIGAIAQKNSLSISEIGQESLIFEWENQNPSDCFLEYGFSPEFELGKQKGFMLQNLESSTTYYIRAFKSENGVNQYSDPGIFSTASKSSGEIKVYFNHWVDNDASDIANAITTYFLEDTLTAYINSAVTTLDICNYNTGSLPIVTAINNAEVRGVEIRYIAADNTGTNNDEIDNLSATIPFIQRPDDGEVMHNKFMIIDSELTEKAIVVTGSTNHTNASCHDDYNNMVIVTDQSLALAYKIEFEEMWGSNTNTPNSANAKFGADKTDNTPHSFNIGGIPVELYFSPSDGTTAHIESAILSADNDMQFAMLTFINNDLGDAVIDVFDAGVEVKGIIENVLYFGSEYNGLVSAGVDVWSHQTEPYFFHHKYGVVDANDVTSDPLVITGSHNWTNSAEEDYDENTLIIHSLEIANMYYEEFMARYSEITGAESNKVISLESISIYPNPASDFITIESLYNNVLFQVFDITGKLVFDESLKSKSQMIDISKLSQGIYQYQLISNGFLLENGKLIIE
jgi:phosphatidylserine/phosphatidylglycerophosphate/cardiolipin synthase-like enzyme